MTLQTPPTEDQLKQSPSALDRLQLPDGFNDRAEGHSTSGRREPLALPETHTTRLPFASWLPTSSR